MRTILSDSFPIRLEINKEKNMLCGQYMLTNVKLQDLKNKQKTSLND